jgi:two-component system, LytTR family, response regulator LytT
MSATIKAIVIDDEPYSRDELVHLLGAFPAIEVIGEAEKGKEGLELTLSLQPDVIFVDIEMGEMSGIDMVEVIQKLKEPPRVVFATAYPDYAVKAFRFDAIDYLLKPFSEDELKDTVGRITAYFKEKGVSDKNYFPTKLAVDCDGEIVYLPPEDISYCSRVERETHIYTNDKKYITKIPLKDLEDKLNTYPFFRTHKSYLVNLNEIEKMIPWCNGAYHVKVKGRTEEVQVSRNYVKELREKLEL